MEAQSRGIKKLAPFVSEPFRDDDGQNKYQVSRMYVNPRSGKTCKKVVSSGFCSKADAEAYAHKRMRNS